MCLAYEMKVNQVVMIHKRETRLKASQRQKNTNPPHQTTLNQETIVPLSVKKEMDYKRSDWSLFQGFVFLIIIGLSPALYAQNSPYDERVDIEQPELFFTVVDIQRPITRIGKTLTSPRHIYLFASREPKPVEARQLARSEKRALKRRRRSSKSRRRRRGAKQEAQGSSLIHTAAPWEGRLLKASRLGPPRQRAYRPTYLQRLREYEATKIKLRDEAIAAQSENGSPIALSTPAASVDLLESSDDDDELSGAEDGEICGHLNEPCCQTTTRGSCEVTSQQPLMCVQLLDEKSGDRKSVCRPPPEPCGGFEQMCCKEELSCRRAALRCLARDGYAERCLLPDLPPERLKTPIGILEIVEVQGRLVKAAVRYDALIPQRNHQPLNAVKRGDQAIWY